MNKDSSRMPGMTWRNEPIWRYEPYGTPHDMNMIVHISIYILIFKNGE